MKKAKKSLVYLTIFLICICASGQEERQLNHKINFSGYVDTYFSSYTNELPSETFQPFETVGARSNSIGINVAQFSVQYKNNITRANLTLHWGDIPKATWSSNFNEIQEANVGIKLYEGLWLDAGFFTTHIGTESFLPKNNMLSNTAFKTYNEPFYQAGAKLGYDKLNNWLFEFWVLNGYNNFVDNNDAKSIGVLVSHNFSESTSLTYTNIYGRESEDGSILKQNRFYQNIYLNKNWSEKWFLTLGLDYGIQTNSDLDDPNKTASMYAALATVKHKFNSKFSITGRAEIFKDENGFISGTVLNRNEDIAGVELLGLSLGTEYRPIDNVYVRAESRFTQAAKVLPLFIENGATTNERFEVLFTMGFELSKLITF